MATNMNHPKHPERICWGCEKLCSVTALECRETRAMHPAELFGDNWDAEPPVYFSIAPVCAETADVRPPRL